MEVITLPIAELKPALIGLSKVITKRPTLPVLGMIKIERTADGWIALTGTDLDTFVTVRMEQPAEGPPLNVLVPLEELQTAIKPCTKTESIQIQPLTPERITIKTPVGAGWAETKCDSVLAAEFPALPQFKGDLVPMPDAVRLALHEAFACASTDETRLVLNGAYLDVSKKDCHCVVGTDGRHLYSSNSFSLPTMKESVIIPSHRFLDWKEFNHDGEWRLKAGLNAENKELLHLQLTSRRWRFITRQFDGAYPNWRQVLVDPHAIKTHVQIEDAAAVMQVISRMPDHDPVYHAIGIMVEGESLLLLGKANAQDSDWFPVPIPNAKTEGSSVRVNVNRQLLTKALEFGLSRIDFIDTISPLRFSNEGRQMVVMPVRVEGPVQSAATASTPMNTATSDGKGEAGPVVSEPNQPAANTDAAQQEGNQPMPEQPNTPPTPAAKDTKNTENGYNIEMLIEQTLTGIEELQEAVDGNVESLTSLRAKVKILSREYKASTKETDSLKKALKGLQSVKL
jgi:DNA polymerase III sliding clamp (beta) subunit (PCNA family)